MKVLVTAATRHGSTAEIGAAILRVLHLRGIDADHVAPSDLEDISGYDAVVLGSAIYAGRWLAPATSLVTRFAPRLAEIPVWLFSSGPVGEPRRPEEPAGLATISAQTGALEHRLFAGKLDKSELGLLERAMVRAVHASDGDYRSWGDISRWASEIADTLTLNAPGPARR